MLVLSRRRNESIVIGHGANKVTITIVEIRGDKVRLGIEAPVEVPVHRQEVYDIVYKGEQNEQKGKIEGYDTTDPMDV